MTLTLSGRRSSLRPFMDFVMVSEPPSSMKTRAERYYRCGMPLFHSCTVQALVSCASLHSTCANVLTFLSRRGLRNSTTRTVLVLIIMIIFLSSTATIISNLIQDVVQITGLGNPEYNFGPAKLKSNIVSTFTTRISVSHRTQCRFHVFRS